MTSHLPVQVRLKSDIDFASSITCILCDVDGVLTDGKLTYGCDASGAELEFKSFHVRDGLGIKLWLDSGFHFGIITARTSPLVARRASELGVVDLIQNSRDKWKSAQQLMQTWGAAPDQVCYIGDDLPDLCVMRRVGLAAAPDDAATDARETAHWTMRARGGEGAVRELIERLLRSAGHWDSHVNRLAQITDTPTKTGPHCSAKTSTKGV